MEDYFTGAVRQLLTRAHHLPSRVSPDLPPPFGLLLSSCRGEIDRVSAALQSLLDDPDLRLPANQPVRLRLFRRLVADLDLIETHGIAALERRHEDDLRLNELLGRICHEVRYPLPPPVVTTLSQAYFRIIPSLNLLCVPLTEGRFLLHLPDLFHEIAHPLLDPCDGSAVKPFHEALAQALLAALEYLEVELRTQERSRGPSQPLFALRAWTQSWTAWAIEMMCDLFATFTAGPAFAWSHLHLCAKRGSDPYAVPQLAGTSHPADGARMDVMLRGLSKTGFAADAGHIHDRWQQFVEAGGYRAEPEYQRCFPGHLLQQICDAAYQGVSGLGCRFAAPGVSDPVYALLNRAWAEFWRCPAGYDTWEQQAIAGI